MSKLDALSAEIELARIDYTAALARQERARKAMAKAGEAVNATAKKLNDAREAFMHAGDRGGGFALFLGR